MDRQTKDPAARAAAPDLIEAAGDADGVVLADPKEGDMRARGRSLWLRSLAGVGLVVGIAAMLIAPITELLGNAQSWAAAVPVVTGAGLLATLAALAVYQFGAPREPSERRRAR